MRKRGGEKSSLDGCPIVCRTSEPGRYLKNIVYGGLDGIITTFAIVAGVTGASLSSGIILILGFANLLADGFSMAIGDYLSTKAKNEFEDAVRSKTHINVCKFPSREREHMAAIYQDKGLDQKDAQALACLVAKNKKVWVDNLLHHEHGIGEPDGSPVKDGLVTFLSFVMFGFVPLLTYVLSAVSSIFVENRFLTASVLTGMTLFALGAFKTKFTSKDWVHSGVEMLLIGGVGAMVAYVIGYLLAGLA